MTATVEERAADLLAWCAERQATVRWHTDRLGPLCTVEVPRPGMPWVTLRGQGDTFAAAVGAARVELAAAGRADGPRR